MAKKVYKETSKKTVKKITESSSKTKKIILTIVASVLALGLVTGLCILAINEAKNDTPTSTSVPAGDNFGGEVDPNPDDDGNWTNNY